MKTNVNFFVILAKTGHYMFYNNNIGCLFSSVIRLENFESKQTSRRQQKGLV